VACMTTAASVLPGVGVAVWRGIESEPAPGRIWRWECCHSWRPPADVLQANTKIGIVVLLNNEPKSFTRLMICSSRSIGGSRCHGGGRRLSPGTLDLGRSRVSVSTGRG
jgi:hypothetical protein